MSEAGAVAPAGGAPEGGVPPADGTQGGQPPVIDLEGIDHPEELRPYLEQYIREKVDPTVGEKLREAAETRKQFEPLSGIEGLSDIDPEALGQLVAFHEIASDPEQFTEWFTDVARESAKANPEQFEEWWANLGREMDWLDDDGEGDAGDGELEDDPRISALEQQLAEMRQAQQQEAGQREQSQRVQERQQVIDGQLNESLAKLGEMDDEAKAAARQDILKLAIAYADDPDNSIPKAFEDYLRITGKGASDLIDSKLEQPDGGLPRGRAADSRPEVTPDNVKEIARGRFNGRVGAT
jgi:hypothetical protein